MPPRLHRLNLSQMPAAKTCLTCRQPEAFARSFGLFLKFRLQTPKKANPMSVLITGSIAYDAVFSFAGAFGEQITHPVEPGFNTTFLTRAMRRDFGGCAGNIAVAMKRMGGEPLIWGAVGRDGGDYLEHFVREGIRTDGIGVFSNAYTAQCLIITDHMGAQIAAFHPGAAERTPEVRWPTDADGKEAQPAIAILSPGGRETTLFAAQACRAREIPYFFDVGQELPLFSAEELLDLAHHAVGIIYSDSEAEAFEQKTQQSDADLAESGLIVVRTLGSRGARVWLPGERHAAFVPTVPIQKVRSPVGAGDAFRGGFLYALERGFSPVEAAQWGAVAAGRKVAGAGAQDYELTPQAAQLDFDQWFGKQSRK